MTHLRQKDRSAPRKKPHQARAISTVGAIVEAAARILETVGLAGFNTNAIAEKAGVSVGTFYQYFPNKEAVMDALLRRKTDLALAQGEKALDQKNGPEMLRALIQTAVDHQLRRPALARILDFEEACLPQAAITVNVRARFRQLIECALRCDDFSELSLPLEAPEDLLAIIRGMVDAAGERGEDRQRSLEARVERAVFGYLDWRGCLAAIPSTL